MVGNIIAGVFLGIIVYLIGAAVHRRYDAVIVAREDYDEDVDGVATKAAKEAFEKRKIAEAELLKLHAVEFAKFAWKERIKRLVIFLVLGAGLGGLAFGFFGMNLSGFLYFLFYALLTIIAFTDLDTMEIPPSLNVIIFVLGVIAVFAMPETTIVQRLIGMACIAVPMILLNLLIPGAFGGGDIKLLIAAGAFLGWKANVIAFFAGAIVAAVISVALIVSKKKNRKEHIPFGPSLCIGYVIASLYGNQIIDWYIGMTKIIMTME